MTLEQTKLQASVNALIRQRDAAQQENVTLWGEVEYWKARAEAAEKKIVELVYNTPEKEPAE